MSEGPISPVALAAELERLGLPALPEPLPRCAVDSHTHADATEEYSSLPIDVSLAAARAVGIAGWVQVGCDVESSRFAVDLARREASVVAAVAIHPNDAARLAGDDRAAYDQAIAEIDRLAGAGPFVRAVGETGIDHFRTRDEAGRRLQAEAFAAHLDIARRHRLTVVVHDRDAHQQVLEVVDAEGVPERLVMHCFSGDATFARACLDRGAWLSFPGVVTFNNAGNLREALAIVPADRLLVETDAPYLTPVPVRGKPNAPYLVPHTLRFIAEQRGDDLATLCDQITANTFAAFGGPWDLSATPDARPNIGVAGGVPTPCDRDVS